MSGPRTLVLDKKIMIYISYALHMIKLHYSGYFDIR